MMNPSSIHDFYEIGIGLQIFLSQRCELIIIVKGLIWNLFIWLNLTWSFVNKIYEVVYLVSKGSIFIKVRRGLKIGQGDLKSLIACNNCNSFTWWNCHVDFFLPNICSFDIIVNIDITWLSRDCHYFTWVYWSSYTSLFSCWYRPFKGKHISIPSDLCLHCRLKQELVLIFCCLIQVAEILKDRTSWLRDCCSVDVVTVFTTGNGGTIELLYMQVKRIVDWELCSHIEFVKCSSMPNLNANTNCRCMHRPL